MNEDVREGMETKIVGTLLDIFKQLPKEFQMIFYGAGLLSAVGLTAYGISHGYSIKKTTGELYFTNQEPVIQQYLR